MYQNGERLNRYARKRKHIDNLKRRTTPLGYGSYEQFCARKRAEEDAPHNENVISYFAKRNLPEWYEQYWNAYSGSWKTRLKEASHRKERQSYREYIDDILKHFDMMDEENMEEIPSFRPRKGQRADDPWNWD